MINNSHSCSRPAPDASLLANKVKTLYDQGMSMSEIAKKLKIRRTSVWRALENLN